MEADGSTGLDVVPFESPSKSSRLEARMISSSIGKTRIGFDSPIKSGVAIASKKRLTMSPVRSAVTAPIVVDQKGPNQTKEICEESRSSWNGPPMRNLSFASPIKRPLRSSDPQNDVGACNHQTMLEEKNENTVLRVRQTSGKRDAAVKTWFSPRKSTSIYAVRDGKSGENTGEFLLSDVSDKIVDDSGSIESSYDGVAVVESTAIPFVTPPPPPLPNIEAGTPKQKRRPVATPDSLDKWHRRKPRFSASCSPPNALEPAAGIDSHITIVKNPDLASVANPGAIVVSGKRRKKKYRKWKTGQKTTNGEQDLPFPLKEEDILPEGTKCQSSTGVTDGMPATNLEKRKHVVSGSPSEGCSASNCVSKCKRRRLLPGSTGSTNVVERENASPPTTNDLNTDRIFIKSFLKSPIDDTPAVVAATLQMKTGRGAETTNKIKSPTRFSIRCLARRLMDEPVNMDKHESSEYEVELLPLSDEEPQFKKLDSETNSSGFTSMNRAGSSFDLECHPSPVFQKVSPGRCNVYDDLGVVGSGSSPSFPTLSPVFSSPTYSSTGAVDNGSHVATTNTPSTVGVSTRRLNQNVIKGFSPDLSSSSISQLVTSPIVGTMFRNTAAGGNKKRSLAHQFQNMSSNKPKGCLNDDS